MKKKSLSSQLIGCPWIYDAKAPFAGHYTVGNGEHHDCKNEMCCNKEIPSALTLFDLSSHERARQAIEFGLRMRKHNFHVFVLGDERSGRMTATLAYLKNYIQQFESPDDWVYLNNFSTNYRPIPFRLPAGKGRSLREDLQELIVQLMMRFQKAFHDPKYRKKIDNVTYQLQTQWQKNLSELHAEANKHQCRIVQTADHTYDVECVNEDAELDGMYDVRRHLNYCIIQGQLSNQKAQERIQNWRDRTAQKVIEQTSRLFRKKWTPYLDAWIDDLCEDILDHIDLFNASVQQDNAIEQDGLPFDEQNFERYSVNILVDHSHSPHPKVVVEPNPTYERLFGTIKYRNGSSGLEPHFTLIRGGALHEANGGILVLRAEALAQAPDVWNALKAALRDRRIRIEERFRDSMPPLWDAPEPHYIPLDVQIFLVASPQWYYDFFCNELDFHNYFKIKADIDSDLPMTSYNIQVYQGLIMQNACDIAGRSIDKLAVEAILRQSARWSHHRHRLSARFEQVGDVLLEAAAFVEDDEGKPPNPILVHHVEQAVEARRKRNSRQADRHFEYMHQEQILVDTQGSHVGQVNGLTVLSMGDHSYGIPCRITARSYIGTQGVINIERLTHMGGAIQQKGTFILEAFLKGTFAQDKPMCGSCSVTFEQNYVDVEGDSATLAELVAILSSLADLPIRQDVAITGAMNQWGDSHSVGGVHTKIEGFYTLCSERGLTGTQGVIIPQANETSLVLRDDVAQAIADQKFSVWSVHNVQEAAEILMEAAWEDTIFPRVQSRLQEYAKCLRDYNSSM